MAKKTADTTTFQALEQEAYHAFLEWPLFLVLKIQTLKQHLTAAQENLMETATGEPTHE